MPGAHLDLRYPRLDRRSVLVIVVALILGLVVGAVVTWMTEDSDPAVVAAELVRSVSPSSTPVTGAGTAAAPRITVRSRSRSWVTSTPSTPSPIA